MIVCVCNPYSCCHITHPFKLIQGHGYYVWAVKHFFHRRTNKVWKIVEIGKKKIKREKTLKPKWTFGIRLYRCNIQTVIIDIIYSTAYTTYVHIYTFVYIWVCITRYLYIYGIAMYKRQSSRHVPSAVSVVWGDPNIIYWISMFNHTTYMFVVSTLCTYTL